MGRKPKYMNDEETVDATDQELKKSNKIAKKIVKNWEKDFEELHTQLTGDNDDEE